MPMTIRPVAILVGASFAMASGGARAQISTDGSLSPAVKLNGPHHAVGAALGRQLGPNLFHSFSAFSLASGQSATFFGNGSGIRNVLSRVTGGAASSIDGTIRMDPGSLPSANLFFINPKGILFGPNARLDLTGAFHASTADYIKLGGAGRFDATDPARDVLTSAPPEAFGFLGSNSASIAVQGSDLSIRNEQPDKSLVVREGAGVSLIAGGVSLSDSKLHTVHGDIRLVAAAGGGEVSLTDAVSSSAMTTGQMLVERSTLSTDGMAAAPGRIVIRGGALRLDESKLASANRSTADAPPIVLQGSGDVSIASSRIETETHAGGAGSAISISGRSVTIERVANIQSGTYGQGDGGSIDIAAGEKLRMLSATADDDYSYVHTFTVGSGKSGAIRLAADRLDFHSPYIWTYTNGAGDAGPVQLTAREAALVDGTYILTWSEPGATGRTSAIDVRASERLHFGGLDIFGFKAEIVAFTEGSGHAGRILVRAPDVLVRGGNIASMTWGDGNSGTVRVEGDDVRFIAGDGAHARAASITFGPGHGDGGNVEVVATRSFELNGNGFLGDWTHFVTATEASGRGGNILIDAPSVSIDRGNLFARTRFGTGLAGSIRVNAESVMLRNEGGIGSINEGPREGASVTIATRSLDAADTSFISADATSSGNAGKVLLTAQRARFTGASGITAASFGSGNAGNVVVEVSESLEMVERSVGTYQDLGGGGPRGAPVWPGGFVLSASGTGSAGSFHLRAPSIVLDDGRIRSTAEAAGDGGRVTIEADTLVMRNGAQIDAKTAPDSSGAAGSMSIRVSGRFDISGRSAVDGAFSGLYAETQGSGRGGNIDVRADTLSVDRAIIRSSTAGSGRAGSIHIDGGDVALTRGGWIDAGTSADSAGPGGDIQVRASRSLTLSGHDNVRLDAVTPPSGVRVSPATLGRQEAEVPSAISSNTSGAGTGGNVTLVSPRVNVADGARISANSSGSATAGSILIDARPGSIVIQGGSITTQAGSSDGGNIALLAGNRVHIRGGEVSTSVGAGAGSGGNIFIDPTFVILEKARIAANAFGGAGGNIGIVTGYFMASADSTLEASSQLGLAGSVQISAIQSEALAALPALPAQFFDTSGVLREACTARAAGASRLVDVGRGGIAMGHAGYAASRYFDDMAPAIGEYTSGPSRASAPPGQSVLLAGVCRS